MNSDRKQELSQHYGSDFYQKENRHSQSSAQVIVPLIMELLAPSSVIDIGCGQGEWLSEFAKTGVEIFGVDGPHIQETQLLIPKDKFQQFDLSKSYSTNQKYSLAISLEVGEHLPENISQEYVNSLTRLAPAVVFSAALPGQGGVNHVNEQWPWYWKSLFEKQGYVRLDPFRHRIWHNPKVAFYYQQNLFLYVDPKHHHKLISESVVEDKYSELTLIKTTLLQDMTADSTLLRAWKKTKRMIGLS
ncbi:MAG: class I SAM-dependent methyltransferase [Planctomycetia bacterium]|nr:class I SAM-dependent methyltransferase [Planctomycetia bacterium]